MTRFLPIRAAKELRELFPWWAATVVGMFAFSNVAAHLPDRSGGSQFRAAAIMIYIAGAVALGALSMGQEYSYRTLGALLAQPIDRRRILATKMAVLLPLLAALIPLAAYLFSSNDDSHRLMSHFVYWALVVLPATAGLGLAPWLTMACRGALAGTVFAVVLPLLVFSVAGIYRFSRAEIFLAVLLLNAIGAVMTWRAFMRLEAIEGPQAEIDVPGWIHRQSIDAVVPTRRRNRVWLLVQKELRLQQMTMLISALFVVIWFGVLAARRFVADFQGPDLGIVSVLHGWFVVIVAGALPSAEERQLGTSAWQSLMPMAAWHQWAVKAGVAISLGFALAVGLPLLLASIGTEVWDLSFDWELVLPIVMIIVSALYVSSLNSSGMRAILATFPTGAIAALVGALIALTVGNGAAEIFRPVAEHMTPFAFIDAREWRTWAQWTSVATLTPLVLGLAWLILAFGSANHRSADRAPDKVRRQVYWIVLYVIGATVVLAFVSELLRAGVRGRIV